MLNVYYSNRLDALIEPLAEAVRERNRRDPLETMHIIVPNRAMGAWLNVAIAESVGVASNIEYPFLNSYLQQLAESVEIDGKPLGVLTRERFALLFFHELDSIEAQSAPELARPNKWINAAPTEKARGARRWEMSRKLGDIFHEYAFNRSDLLQEWARKSPVRNADWSQTSNWQHALWWRVAEASDTSMGWCLRSRDGDRLRERAASRESEARTWSSLPEVVTVTRDSLNGSEVTRTQNEIHLFGITPPGIALLEQLTLLSEGTDVSFYLLNPSAEFWDDVEDARLGELLATDRLPKRADAPTSPENANEEDLFGLDNEADPALLRLWGKTGRELVMLLTELTHGDFTARFHAPPIQSRACLLRDLQRQVLFRKQEALPKTDSLAKDGSVRFFKAPTVLRELEHVAEDIEQKLAEDSSLRPTDFAVMVAGDFDAYVALSRKAFAVFGTFPVELIDAPLGSRSRVGDAADKLISLFSGGFERREVESVFRELLALRGDTKRFDTWKNWFEETGVVMGLSAEDLEDTYLDSERFHWNQAAHRISLGCFVETDLPGQESGIDWIHGAPVQQAGDGIEDVTALIIWLRACAGDREFFRGRHPLVDWVTALNRMLRFYVRPEDALDERVLQRLITRLESLADADPLDAPIPAHVFISLARSAISSIQARTSLRMVEGVRFGPLESLAGIPHKRTYVVGLNDGEFPKRDMLSTLDVRRDFRRKGDVRRQERDRFQLLMTLMNTSDSLTCSYHAVDPESGEDIAPSSTVHELLHAVHETTGMRTSPDHLVTSIAVNPERNPTSAARTATSIRTAALAREIRNEWRDKLHAQTTDEDRETLPQGFIDTRNVLQPTTLQTLRPVLRLASDAISTERTALADQYINLNLNDLARFLLRPVEAMTSVQTGVASVEWLDIDEDVTESLQINQRLLRRLSESAMLRGGPLDRQLEEIERELNRRGEMPDALFIGGSLASHGAVIANFHARLERLRETEVLAEDVRFDAFQPVCIGAGRPNVEYASVLPPVRLRTPGGEVYLTAEAEAVHPAGHILSFDWKKKITFAERSFDKRRRMLLLLRWMVLVASGHVPAEAKLIAVAPNAAKSRRSTLENVALTPAFRDADEVLAVLTAMAEYLTNAPRDEWVDTDAMMWALPNFHALQDDVNDSDSEPPPEDWYDVYARHAIESRDMIAAPDDNSGRFTTGGPDMHLSLSRLPIASREHVERLMVDIYAPIDRAMGWHK